MFEIALGWWILPSVVTVLFFTLAILTHQSIKKEISSAFFEDRLGTILLVIPYMTATTVSAVAWASWALAS